ncbi:unnamed protein product [Ixodes persulcatus]
MWKQTALGLSVMAAVLTCAAAQCSGVEIVPRRGWGARAPKGRTAIKNSRVPYVFIHHTTGSGCDSKASCSRSIRGHQNYHMDKNGWSDIGYSFLVGGDGRVYEGRGWGTVGAHTRGYNSNGIAISFVGNFMTQKPNQAMLNAAQKLIACGIKMGKISSTHSLHGHRDANCTACPGDMLYNIIKKWARFGGRLKKFLC